MTNSEQQPLPLTSKNALGIALQATREHFFSSLGRNFITSPLAVLSCLLTDLSIADTCDDLIRDLPSLIGQTITNSPANHALINLESSAKMTRDIITFDPRPNFEDGVGSGDLAALALWIAHYANNVRFRQSTLDYHPSHLMRIIATVHNKLHERSSGKRVVDHIWNLSIWMLEALNLSLSHALPYTNNLSSSLAEASHYATLDGGVIAALGILPSLAFATNLAIIVASVSQYGYLTNEPLSQEPAPAEPTPSAPPLLSSALQGLQQLLSPPDKPKLSSGPGRQPSRHKLPPGKTERSDAQFKPFYSRDINGRLSPPRSGQKSLEDKTQKRLSPPK